MLNVLSLRGFTVNPVNAVLVTGTTSTYTTTVIATPILDGKFQTTLAAQTNAASPTTDFNTGLAFPALVGGASVAGAFGHGCVVVWGLSAGVTKVVMGPHADLDAQGNFKWDAPQFPAIPANFVPFAYQVLKAGATASATAIIFGTASWAATGYTNAIQNIAVLPTRPQVS